MKYNFLASTFLSMLTIASLNGMEHPASPEATQSRPNLNPMDRPIELPPAQLLDTGINDKGSSEEGGPPLAYMFKYAHSTEAETIADQARLAREESEKKQRQEEHERQMRLQALELERKERVETKIRAVVALRVESARQHIDNGAKDFDSVDKAFAEAIAQINAMIKPTDLAELIRSYGDTIQMRRGEILEVSTRIDQLRASGQYLLRFNSGTELLVQVTEHERNLFIESLEIDLRFLKDHLMSLEKTVPVAEAKLAQVTNERRQHSYTRASNFA